MRPTSPAGSAERGFTLLELLVVLAIISLLLWVAAPRFEGATQPSLATRAGLLASELRMARQRAISTARPERVSLAGPAGAGAQVGATTGPKEVLFFPDGSSTGGRILLQDQRRQALVTVDFLTGAVHVASP
jgi:general secretion pathway protein H